MAAVRWPPFSMWTCCSHPSNPPVSALQKLIESSSICWDLKLKGRAFQRGHHSAIADPWARDFTIQTAFAGKTPVIRCRYALAQNLDETLQDRICLQAPAAALSMAKLKSRDARAPAAGSALCRSNPNVKEARGGLRDLAIAVLDRGKTHSIASKTPPILVDRGRISGRRVQTFVAAENFLCAVRGILHLLSGTREQKQLTLDMQVGRGEAMLLRDTREVRPRRRKCSCKPIPPRQLKLARLTGIFLDKLEALHVKAEPLLERIFRHAVPSWRDGYEGRAAGVWLSRWPAFIQATS